MYKKSIVAFSAVGLILVIVLTILLMGRNSRRVRTDAATTAATVQSSGSGGVQDETAVQDGSIDFTTAAGVGNKEDWGQTETLGGSSQGAEQTQNRQPTSVAQPSGEEQSNTLPGSAAADDGMPDVMLTYEAFIRMSEDEQDAYFLQFDDPRDFAAWLKTAKQEYEDNQTAIVITGPIDLSTLPEDGN